MARSRICALNINSEESSAGFLPLLRDAFARSAGPETSVDIRSPVPALSRALDATSAYFSLLNEAGIVEAAMKAEADGYDAVIVCCCMDPAIREAREMVDIPVVGMGEASMLAACQIGTRFAIVTLREPKVADELGRLVVSTGLSSPSAAEPVHMVDIPSREWLRSGADEPAPIVNAVTHAARRAVAAGADIVVLGCVGLAPIVTRAGLQVLEPEGAPILDCVHASVAIAELRIGLHRACLPATSRAGPLAKPSLKDIARVRARFGL